MNLLTHRIPTIVYRTDACKHGIGGYSSRGRAWRWELPLHMVNRLSTNTLEFLAGVTSLIIDAAEATLTPLDCVLIQTDNTTGEGWLRKSNFCATNKPQHLHIARKLATTCLQQNTCLYSEWIRGTDNPVADSLSRDFHASDTTLTTSLSSLFPSQVPLTFNISPPPKDIVSWLTSLLASAPASKESPPLPKRSGIQHGSDGTASYVPSVSSMISSLTPSPNLTAVTESSQHLQQPSETADFLQNVLQNWHQGQSKMPSAMWQRPSGLTIEWTQGSLPKDPSHSFYNANSDHTDGPMDQKTNNEPPRSVSSEQSQVSTLTPSTWLSAN